MPKAHAEWWAAKLATTRERDRDTDARLVAAGWTPLRIWEHEVVDDVVARIVDAVQRRRASVHRSAAGSEVR